MLSISEHRAMDPNDIEINPNQKQNEPNEKESSYSSASQINRPASPDPAKKIIDLNDDCLLKIFQPFDLCNLFNVAVANEFLRPAADAVYKRKFGATKVLINHDEPEDFPLVSGPHFIYNQIRVYGFQQCLQYLRCFGASITRLIVFSRKWTNEQCQHIFQYVNDYCAPSLIQIQLMGKPSIAIGSLTTPFVNVESISIFDHDLGDQLPSFPQRFPSLRTLKLNNVRADKRWVETPFHHLRDLHIDINEDGFRRFKGQDVAVLLLKCQQMHTLHIHVYDLQGMALKTVVNFIESNQKIRNVNIRMEAYSMVVMPSEVEQLAMENPSLAELHLMSYVFTDYAAITLIENLKCLKMFRFQIEDKPEYDRLVLRLGTNWQSSLEFDSWGCSIVTVKRTLNENRPMENA